MARRRRTGESQPPLLGLLDSPRSRAHAGGLTFLFPAAERRQHRSPDLAGARNPSDHLPTPTRASLDHAVLTIVLATPSRISSSTPRRRSITGATSPSTSEPPATTVPPLPVTQGEHPTSVLPSNRPPPRGQRVSARQRQPRRQPDITKRVSARRPQSNCLNQI